MTPVHAGAVIIERRASDEHILEFIGLVGTVCGVGLLRSYARVSWAALHIHELFLYSSISFNRHLTSDSCDELRALPIVSNSKYPFRIKAFCRNQSIALLV